VGSRAGARNVALMVRGGFQVAITRLTKEGTISGIADLWQDIIATDPARALELLAKYVPREMLVEIDDARPFAFLAEPLTPAQWTQAHAPRVIEHDDTKPTDS